mmetsp:Transcript_169803/g.412767  ORF Transcript_169803/g.412767 Transcript_169803/m.412767 type:complete len:89 (-) Transcript_169803:274-540(-)
MAEQSTRAMYRTKVLQASSPSGPPSMNANAAYTMTENASSGRRTIHLIGSVRWLAVINTDKASTGRVSLKFDPGAHNATGSYLKSFGP